MSSQPAKPNTMKNLPYLLLITTCLFSCKGNQKASIKKSDTLHTKSASLKDQTAGLVIQYQSFIDGAWVNKEYIDEIVRTKSPKEAFNKTGDMTTMLIDVTHIKNDTSRIAVGYGNHEGGEMMLKFLPGRIPGSIRVAEALVPDSGKWFYELKYAVGNHDTTLMLYSYDVKTNKLKDSTVYIRPSKKFQSTGLGSATYYLVNKVLIAGTYVLADSLNQTKRVIFYADGKVTGLDGYKSYYVNVDFTTPPNNLDDILFSLGGEIDKNAKSYAYHFDNDTLKIFETSMAKDSIDEVLGKLKYKLVRQHTTSSTR